MISTCVLASVLFLQSVHGIDRAPLITHTGPPTHEEESPNEQAFKNCKAYVIKGDRAINSTTILGTLDKLDVEHSLTFDFQPIFPTSIPSTYKLVFFPKEMPGMGSEIVATGTKKGYRVKICGPLELTIDKCTRVGDLYRSGEWLHVYAHQFKNRLHFYSRRVYINDALVKYSGNVNGGQARNIEVVATIPIPGKPLVIRNMYFGACDSKFHSNNKGKTESVEEDTMEEKKNKGYVMPSSIKI